MDPPTGVESESSVRVLVVGRDDLELAPLERFLAHRGVRCLSAVSCFQALREVQERRVHAVVADLFAPHEESMWLLGALRARFPEVRRVLMSDRTEAAVEPHLRSGLVQGVVSKPVDGEELLQALVVRDEPA